jgi:hypothetical protein
MYVATSLTGVERRYAKRWGIVRSMKPGNSVMRRYKAIDNRELIVAHLEASERSG